MRKLLLTFVLALALCVPSLAAETWNVGTWKTAQTIQPFLYEPFANGATVKVHPFTNPGDQKAALLAGSLDMTGTTLALAIQAASRGEPIVLVASLGNKCSALVVKKGGVKSVGDLEGKKIGYVPGTMHEILLRETLTRAGLNPVVFVQKQVSAAKIFKSLVYGGRVVRIDGDMAAASRICGEMVKRRNWFQCGGPNPYRIAAKRTFAYGVVQQLGQAPDTVLIPCGGGAGMVAAFDAFREMLAAGVIDRMPRLVGVQLQACDPTARAFHEGRDNVTPVDKKPSLSDAIMNNNPYWGRYCLQAVRETGGTMISVSDADFIHTIRELGREEGLFTEPAGSVSVAALRYLVKVPGFENPGVTVCNLTGHGLNAPQVATDERETPGVIPPTVEAVEAFLQS